jgi:hypothetical protein
MERYLVTSLGVLLASSISVFLLYVAILPLAVIGLVLLGLILTFSLGLYLGTQETIPIGHTKQKMIEMWRRFV